MQDTIKNYIQTLIADRAKRRKTGMILCVLSLLVTGGVFWQLRMTGITMSNEACCGKAEHTHSEECIEMQLICGLQEETPSELPDGKMDTENIEETEVQGHVHTAKCYKKVYTCGLEEHTHTLMCYSDPKADLETASDWESTLPDSMPEDPAEKLAAVAQSQIGYQESNYNFILANDNKTVKGYTRYGDWYGNPYGDWNAMFVSFCLNYADIRSDVIQYSANAYTWTAKLKECNLLRQPKEYMPAPGDMVFFDRDENGAADEMGIVFDVKDQKTLVTIEGDSENRVEKKEYALQDASVFAYVHISKDLELEKSLKEGSLTAALYEYEKYRKAAEGGAEITVSGMLPEGASAKAYPVEVTLPGREVLWAFDISVFTKDGDLWEPKDKTLNVSVQLPQTYDLQENETLSVYYVPKENTGERVVSQLNGDTVSFEAKHLSVYAAARAVGTPVTNAEALKTAFTDGQTQIYLDADFTISGTIAINAKAYSLDLNGHTLTVTGTDTDTLFNIGGNGSLTIRDTAAGTDTDTFTYTVTESKITDSTTGATTETKQTKTVKLAGQIIGGGGSIVEVNGGTFTMESGALCNGAGRAINMASGTADLKGGYIFGFKVNIKDDMNFGGAVLASGGTLNLSGTVLAKNEALNGGAIYAKNATVNITNGVISENKSTRKGNGWGDHSEGAPYRCGGGGIFCDGNTRLNMSGGYITNNKASDESYFDGGGGVLISGTTVFTMNGGYITGNEAAGGGGVRSDWNKETTFVMNGGHISGNTARSTEGGGVAITQGGTGEINGGYITNNKTNTSEHWGGGGLFCSDGAYLRVYKVLVTDNTAGGFGGGVAGCSTGRVYICVKDGGAIYANEATGKNLSGNNSQKGEDHTYGANSPVFMANGYADYFCALNSLVEGGMLGSGTANWSGSMDGVAIHNVPKEAILEAAYVMGLTSAPSDADIAAAQGEAKVFINGNSSYTHGGGILCNGYLLVGDKNPIAVGSRLTLNGTKALTGANLADYAFTFHVTDEDDNIVSIGTSDAEGNINFDRLLSFTEELCKKKITEDGGTADFVYYLKEQLDPAHPEIAIDTTQYKITVTIQRIDEDVPFVDEEGKEIKKIRYEITTAKVEKSTDNGNTWSLVSQTPIKTDEQRSATLQITNGATFTNKFGETTSFTVAKRWVGGEYSGSITVDLLCDGEVYIRDVVLNKNNDWTYTWDRLPAGHTYTVQEHPVPGYNTTYENGIADGKPAGWYKVDQIKEGGVYLLVSADGFALVGNPAEGGAYNFGAGSWKQMTVEDGFIKPDGITEAMQWNATGIANKQGLYLKNLPSDKKHYLSYQNTDTVKVSSGDTGYASRVVEDCGKGLQLYKQGSTSDIKYAVKSGTAAKANTNNTNALYLYELSGSGNGMTIINTKTEDSYGIKLTKVDADDETKTLAGAIFQLLQDGKELTFRQENDQYIYDAAGTITDLVTDANGQLDITGLPKGTYTLHEKTAPEGYEVAEDRTVTFQKDDGTTVLEITVEDTVLSYTLPETGGPGQIIFMVTGLLLMTAAVICGAKRRAERRAKR